MTGKADTPYHRNRLRLMGFDEDQVNTLVSGKAGRQLQDAVLRRGVRLTATNRPARAEVSPLRQTRTFQTLIPFTQYFSDTMRTHSKIIDEVQRSWKALPAEARTRNGTLGKSKEAKDFRAAVTAWGRFYLGKTLSGALINLLVEWIKGGQLGLIAELEEAKENPIKWLLWDSLAYTLFGGIQGSLIKTVSQARSGDDVWDAAGRALYPVNVTTDIVRAITKSGPYKDMGWMEAGGEWVQRNTPGLQTVPTAYMTNLLGLGYTDVGYEASRRAYWRWRRKNLVRGTGETRGKTTVGTEKTLQQEKDHREFRKIIRRAVESARAGEDMDAIKLLQEALQLETKDRESIKKSLRGRRLLAPLDEVQLEDLKDKIGDKPFARLQAEDRMLEQLMNTF